MLVTSLVSHVDMCPYVVVALASSSHQAETAVRRLVVAKVVVSFLLVATDGKIATALWETLRKDSILALSTILS